MVLHMNDPESQRDLWSLDPDTGELVKQEFGPWIMQAFAVLARAGQLAAAGRDHGRHSIYAVASGRAPHESTYALQKLIRAGFGTNYIDNCSRA